MTPRVRVLGIQLDVKPGDPEGNSAAIVELLERHGLDFDLLVFPEMAVPGYFVGDIWERPGFVDRCEEACQRIVAAAQQCAVVFGSVGRDFDHRGEDGRPRLFNAAWVAQYGQVVAAAHLSLPFWPKSLLPNYRVFDDARHFYDLRRLAQDRGWTPAEALRPVHLKTPRSCIAAAEAESRPDRFAVGLTVCEDLWSDDYSFSPFACLGDYRNAAHATGQPPLALVVNLSASPYTKGKRNKRHRVLTARQRDVGVPILYVNNIGIGNNGKNLLCFDGASAVCGGGSLRECPPFVPSLLACEISLPAPGEATVRVLDEDATTQVVDDLSQRTPTALDGSADMLQDDPGLVSEALRYGIRSACTSWSINHVVIGASGGIDSSLAAALFCAALGPDHITLINMPSRHNSQTLQRAAAELARRLGTRYHVMGIDDGVAQLTTSLTADPVFAPLLGSHVYENIQARDRGRILAATSAALGGVFSCNANKSELTTGYGTLYGDLAGFLAPLGDLWKSEVYALAHHINGTSPSSQTPSPWFAAPPIPEIALTIRPSAELSPEQDVDAGKGDPLDYDYHDRLFRLWTESWLREDLASTIALYDQGALLQRLGLPPSRSPVWLVQRPLFVADTQRWWRLYNGLAAFKRVQSPPLLTISRRGLGLDHRESVGLPH